MTTCRCPPARGRSSSAPSRSTSCCTWPPRSRPGCAAAAPGTWPIRAAVIAGLCLAIVTLFPGRPAANFSVAVLTVAFAVTARNDIAPPARPARRISPDRRN